MFETIVSRAVGVQFKLYITSQCDSLEGKPRRLRLAALVSMVLLAAVGNSKAVPWHLCSRTLGVSAESLDRCCCFQQAIFMLTWIARGPHSKTCSFTIHVPSCQGWVLVYWSPCLVAGIVLVRLAMAPLLLLGHPYSEASAGYGHVRWTFAETPEGDRTRVAGRGVRRQRGADVTLGRVKLVVPQPRWLCERMHDCGVQNVNSADSDCIVLFGLADVEPGQCLEPLSMWSEDLSCVPTWGRGDLVLAQLNCLGDEATLLWTFLEYPKDLATCCVRQVWKATTKTLVHSRYRAENGKRPGSHEKVLQLSRDPHLCWPVIDESTLLACADGTAITLADLLCEFTEALPIQALSLPNVIMELVCEGAWRELPLLGSWGPHLFEDWPLHSWMQDRLH
eukprot:576397-Amphidinium_carterae.1